MITPTQGKARRFVAGYLIVVAVISAFGAGLLIGGSARGATSKPKVSDAVVSNVTVTNNNSASPAMTVDFNQFWQVWNEIKARYVKPDVKDSDLFYGAMQGMVAGLGDPYSVYFPPQPAAAFARGLAGEFSGIGAEIGIKNNQLLIIAPLPDSPAERAGLRAGDFILAIDSSSTLGMDADTAVNLIRGPANTTTTLTITRAGLTKPKAYVLRRQKIVVPAILYKAYPGGISYVRVMQFNENTMPALEKYIPSMVKNSAGIIIDLRNNPGGYLDSAIALSSEWINSGRIVSEKFRDGSENVHYSNGLHRLSGIPTVILVNGGSASASEIVAGALRDNAAATVIGEKTFGKGSVQDYEELPDGSALKLTIAEWYTPKGTNINKTGITPDIIVKQDFSKEKIGDDSMLKKALEILKKK